jgi:ABC-type branched-subunit amino acid transport system ATPase component
MSAEVILEVRDLAKSFGGVRAVDGVSFSLKRNELMGVIGPNGSGKTTLVNLLSGFVKPDAGRIVYQGQDIPGWAP